ncbi:HAD family hydrolase [Kitasatospora sp. NPDC101157]|uniref:HAD family hydrolase n=1 Tax=Kitasatospora sp. NPDC101157 TaxID=3364098 RepID=UPI0037F82B62
MQPRIFMFDLGGVVCRFHRERRIDVLSTACGISPERVDKELYGSGMISAWDRGRQSAEEMLAEIRARLGFPGTPEELRRIWCRAFEPDPEVLAAVDLVRPHRTALFTDNDPLLLAALPDCLPEVHERFDDLLFSCLLGVTKPSAEAFGRALARLGAAAEEVFFVDDREQNVLAARALGIRAVLFESGTGLHREIAGLLAD